jgi:hypothetical protein
VVFSLARGAPAGSGISAWLATRAAGRSLTPSSVDRDELTGGEYSEAGGAKKRPRLGDEAAGPREPAERRNEKSRRRREGSGV